MIQNIKINFKNVSDKKYVAVDYSCRPNYNRYILF